jgi:hypothetical protein
VNGRCSLDGRGVCATFGWLAPPGGGTARIESFRDMYEDELLEDVAKSWYKVGMIQNWSKVSVYVVGLLQEELVRVRDALIPRVGRWLKQSWIIHI